MRCPSCGKLTEVYAGCVCPDCGGNKPRLTKEERCVQLLRHIQRKLRRDGLTPSQGFELSEKIRGVLND